MPIYEYRCPGCGQKVERVLPLRHYAQAQRCECGHLLEKIISAPAIFGDYPGYACPVTGAWIEGRRAHEENLRRHDCRVLEPGERQEVIRNRQREDAALEEAVADTAARLVASMPVEKQQQLGQELTHGAAAVVRQ